MTKLLCTWHNNKTWYHHELITITDVIAMLWNYDKNVFANVFLETIAIDVTILWRTKNLKLPILQIMYINVIINACYI